MKIIVLTHGQEAKVSDTDYHYLRQWRWGFVNARKCYARTTTRIGDDQAYMHRLVAARMGLSASRIDHRNGDTLDNRRSNLRAASNSQNLANRQKNRNNTSGYKGVCWDKKAGKSLAQIKVKGSTKNLGRFRSKKEAARRYNQAATTYFGTFACHNPV